MTPCTTCNQTDPNKSCMDCYDEVIVYPPGRPNSMTRQERIEAHKPFWHVWHTCERCGLPVRDCEGHAPADHLARIGWHLLLAAVLLLAVWLGCHALGAAEWLCGAR